LPSGIGWFLQNAAAGSTTARVRLCPSVASPPTLLAEEAQHPVKHEHEHAGARR
jgi:hypothetical protein